MLTWLYLIIIKPIITLLEYLFNLFYFRFDFPVGLVPTIALISFIVSLLCLPFYLKAEKINEEEKALQKKMADRVDVIKQNFKGDEKYFMLQTCYRQNNYHPIMSLRLSLSLLLQIPFFIAAYTFFSHLPWLHGAHFLGIANLAKPDALIPIGNFSINFLPIIMTIINLAAGYVYTGNLKLKDNKVLIAMSLIFLVLLYNSPAALVLYWTFNNIFSLIKNICLKLSDEHFLFSFLSGLFIILYGALLLKNQYYHHNAVLYLAVVFFFFNFFNVSKKIKISENFSYNKLFFTSAFLLFLLTGLLIPTGVISSSPIEFLITTKKAVYFLIRNNLLLYFGIFIFWSSCIFYVLNKKEKKVFAFLLSFLGIAALIDIHYWKLPDIPLLNDLTFSVADFKFYMGSVWDNIIYYVILLVVFLVMLLCIKKKKFSVICNSYYILLIAIIVFSFSNIIKIYDTYKNYENTPQDYNKQVKLINLSKTKKNVIVIFLDRAINSYFPLIVKERPELKEQFRGFDLYPNTISFSKTTVLGCMPMFGGYEYVTQHLDDRKLDFAVKFNEAVTLLPAIFSMKDYSTRIVNSINNSWREEDSYKKGNKGIVYNDLYQKYNIDVVSAPKFQTPKNPKDAKKYLNLTQRNLFFFSLMQILPIQGKKYVYDKGNYLKLKSRKRNKKNFYSKNSIQYYNELENLINFTDTSAQENTFTIYNNWLTHSPCFLQYPGYKLDVDKPIKRKNLVFLHGFDDVSLQHYHVNAAALIFLGKWLDYLKKEGVYDNTRIIIVADHGFRIKNRYKNAFANKVFLFYNPLLLVKDFNSNHELNMNHEEFMTNADTPFLALKGIVENPQNPFTGNYLSDKEKENGLYIKGTAGWKPTLYLNKDYVFTNKDHFYFVKGNPQEAKNWRKNISLKQMKKETHQN